MLRLPALALGLVLFQAPAFSLSRIWEANQVRPQDLAPMGMRAPGDTSMLPYPEGDWRAHYAGSLAWTGWVRSEGRSFTEAASGLNTQTLRVRPMALLDVGLTWFQGMERNRYSDSGRIEARLGETRRSVGLTLVQHVLPGAPGGPYLDMGIGLPDIERQAYVLMLAAGRRGAWHAEYSLAQGAVAEDFHILNLDPGGDGEAVKGRYNLETAAHRILIKFPAAGGRLSAVGAYGESGPRRPEGEFWLSDSTRSVDASLSYAHPWAWGRWTAQTAYREGESFSLGRRIPPGSEGLKRYHYARNHARAWEAGAGRLPGERETGGLRLALSYRDYAWKSTPAEDALYARKETLSYNRLGLSFIANLYGGLYKSAEIIGGDFRAGAWVAETEWRVRARTRAGDMELIAGLAGFRTDFRIRVHGRTITQRFLSVDTSEVFGPDLRGYLAGVTPEIRLRWSLGRLGVEAGAAQIVPVAVSIERPGRTGALRPASSTRYPPFRNGFSAHAGIVAGY